MESRSFRYAPLAVFGVVYVLSCFVGALLLIVEYRPFLALFEYFSGTEAPQLTSAETSTNLLLLVVAPLMLAGGYVLGLRILSRCMTESTSRSRSGMRPPLWLPLVVFAVLAMIGFVSLLRAGAIGRTGAWADYGALVQSRSEIFSQIGFFEFINLYVLIPTAAAWVVVSGAGTTRLQGLLRWTPVAISLVLSLFLFSRKVALTVLLITFFAWAIDTAAKRPSHVRRVMSASIGGLVILYGVLVVAPVYSEASTTASQAAAYAADSTDPERAARAREIAELFGLEDRTKAIVMYSILSPLTRSSAPALYYPVIFPDRHDYYGVDLGQDVLGVGAMPDDNLVVWNYLNPDIPGGATSVSYQFVLYSQIGTLGSIVASFFVGFLLACAWQLSQMARGTMSRLLGAMVLLLAVYLAVDSLRNSLIVSYGVIWGLLFIGVAATLESLVTRTPFSRVRRGLRTSGASPTDTAAHVNER